MTTRPQMIYCAARQKRVALMTKDLGYSYGARMPDTVHMPPVFIDNDWEHPNLEAYVEAIAQHRPDMATVIDWTDAVSLETVLMWAETIAPYVKTIIIIPKVPGSIVKIPHVICGRSVVLGYSVPTSYGATDVHLMEFGRRPVHLLGGSARNQIKLGRYLNVVSLDINSFHVPAKKGRYFHGGLLPMGREKEWRYLREDGIAGAEDGFYLALEHSFRFYRQLWGYAIG